MIYRGVSHLRARIGGNETHEVGGRPLETFGAQYVMENACLLGFACFSLSVA